MKTKLLITFLAVFGIANAQITITQNDFPTVDSNWNLLHDDSVVILEIHNLLGKKIREQIIATPKNRN